VPAFGQDETTGPSEPLFLALKAKTSGLMGIYYCSPLLMDGGGLLSEP